MKEKAREKLAGQEKGNGKEREPSLPLFSPVSSRFIFVFTLSQFSECMTEIQGKLILVRVSEGSSYRESTVVDFR